LKTIINKMGKEITTKEMWLKEFEKELRDSILSQREIQEEVEICRQRGVPKFEVLPPRDWALSTLLSTPFRESSI
jgi:hypothetical protein